MPWLDYLLICIVSVLFVVTAARLQILPRSRRALRVSKRAFATLSSPGLEDVVKERLLTCYSVLLLRNSIAIGVYLLSFLGLVILLEFLSPGFAETLFSLAGIAAGIVCGAVCVWIYNKVN